MCETGDAHPGRSRSKSLASWILLQYGNDFRVQFFAKHSNEHHRSCIALVGPIVSAIPILGPIA
ncbi:hypothetical protein AGR3A_Cc370055 [Agrobacterium tomkonis CFBP 6623]|uniref:Uncharacterized protein n=1 Tax=Agrobacterium tomkonis CFBP 6623 TaxID=1183432 RepID=A0A1S7PZW6_9HYPH|nr:hypothetical protein AGR3A_Cc370055 [Agrobacterium tomkonis CFBP 6623]